MEYEDDFMPVDLENRKLQEEKLDLSVGGWEQYAENDIQKEQVKIECYEVT